MKPFVPEKWASKFKPALGSYMKFVKGLTDIFSLENASADGGNFDIKLKISSGHSPKTAPKSSPKISPKASPKAASKSSPKAPPKESPKLSPKLSPKSEPVKKKAIVKKRAVKAKN